MIWFYKISVIIYVDIRLTTSIKYEYVQYGCMYIVRLAKRIYSAIKCCLYVITSCLLLFPVYGSHLFIISCGCSMLATGRIVKIWNITSRLFLLFFFRNKTDQNNARHLYDKVFRRRLGLHSICFFFTTVLYVSYL